jgi:nucleotide-binding universal stress UspA family protein
MKNILVPVDFSKEASNAAHYAAELAKQTGAQITLFYVFHLPIPISEAPYPIDFRRLEKENTDLLTGLAKELERKHHLIAKHLSAPGFAVDEILDLASTSRYDLIVMGTRGNGSSINQLLGSTSTALLKRSPIPVMAIPATATFKAPVNIVMACDFHQVNNPAIFGTLSSLCKRFHGQVSLLNIVAPGELPEKKKAVEGIKLERYLEGIKHEFCFQEDEHVEMGVDTFLQNHPSDLLVIVPHQHTFLDRLFFKAHTKKLMLHTTIPVLALPDFSKK